MTSAKGPPCDHLGGTGQDDRSKSSTGRYKDHNQYEHSTKDILRYRVFLYFLSLSLSKLPLKSSAKAK